MALIDASQSGVVMMIKIYPFIKQIMEFLRETKFWNIYLPKLFFFNMKLLNNVCINRGTLGVRIKITLSKTILVNNLDSMLGSTISNSQKHYFRKQNPMYINENPRC